jgi:hypothetical protein
MYLFKLKTSYVLINTTAHTLYFVTADAGKFWGLECFPLFSLADLRTSPSLKV